MKNPLAIYLKPGLVFQTIFSHREVDIRDDQHRVLQSMSALLLAFTRVNLWHFVWIAVVLSVLLSLLLSQLIHRHIMWEYPFAVTFIAFTVASLLISLIKRLRNLEQALAEQTGHRVQDVIERRQTEDALRESQERFSSAFKDAAIGMALVGTDGKWLQVNPALCALVGYTEHELLATTFQAITHPDDLDADLAFVQQMLAGEIPTYHMEKRYFHKQGHIVWILLSASLVRDPFGQPLYFIGQIQDITERKQVQEKLRESEARFRAILDNSPTKIFLKDTEGRYLLVNRQFERMFHLDQKTIVGKTDVEIFPPKQAAAFQANDRKVVQAGVPLQFEEEVLLDDGPHTSLVFKFPLRTMDGTLYGIGGITTDITERKQEEEERKKQELLVTLMLSTGPGCIKRLAADGTLHQMNPAGLKMIEADCEEDALGLSVFNLIVPEHRAAFMEMHRDVINGSARTLQFEILGLRGTRRWMETHAVPFQNPVIGQTEHLAVTHDITERYRAEEALRASEEQLRKVLEEREQLSQDLHDNIIQTIYAIGMSLEECRYLFQEAPQEADKKLEHAVASLNRVISDVRNYIEWDNHEAISGQQFCAKLAELAVTMESVQGIHFSLDLAVEAAQRLTPLEALHLPHIVQEAMSNSLRHSQSRNGLISLQLQGGRVRLEIRDDGVGFNLQDALGQGHGLQNMTARAQKLSAHLQIVSKPGSGVQILVELPLEVQHARASS
jgi:PAS domain S-box-containing protein